MYNPNNFYKPTEDQIYHIVYLTTNIINNKIYVGVHSTYNIDDGYIGSGETILSAIKKYGKDKFSRSIIHYAYDRDHAFYLESLIVDINFIKRKDNYNIALGGRGNCSTNPETRTKISKSMNSRSEDKILTWKNKISSSLLNMPEELKELRKKNISKSLQNLTDAAKNEWRSNISIAINDPDKKSQRIIKFKESLENMSDEAKLERSRKQSKAKQGYIPWNKGIEYIPMTDERKLIQSLTHGRVKTYKLIDPQNNEYIIRGQAIELPLFCKEHNLSLTTFKKHIDLGKITNITFSGGKYKQQMENCINWTITEI